MTTNAVDRLEVSADFVQVRYSAMWLEGQVHISVPGPLSPAETRKLAILLLEAADKAEDTK